MTIFTGINDAVLGLAEQSRRKSFGLCYDFKGVGEEWITVKPNGEEEKGTPIKLQGGKISGGAGGKFNGKTLSEAFGARKAGATPKATKAPPKAAKKKQVSAILSQKRTIPPVAPKKSNSGIVSANYLKMKANISAKVLNHQPLGLKFFPNKVKAFDSELSLAIDRSPKIIKNSLEKNLSNGVKYFTFYRPGDKRSDGTLAKTAFYPAKKEISIPPIETLKGGSFSFNGKTIVYRRKLASLFHEIGHAVDFQSGNAAWLSTKSGFHQTVEDSFLKACDRLGIPNGDAMENSFQKAMNTNSISSFCQSLGLQGEGSSSKYFEGVYKNDVYFQTSFNLIKADDRKKLLRLLALCEVVSKKINIDEGETFSDAISGLFGFHGLFFQNSNLNTFFRQKLDNGHSFSGIGHPQNYYYLRKEVVGEEAFANLFSLLSTNRKGYNKYKRLFPELISTFERLLK